jgi:tryptophan 2,3-dioxygenase
MSKALTYSTYLKLDELLVLQQPRSEPPEHDEMLFITIHQVYELWFKQVLHELDRLKITLEADDTPCTLQTLKRILTIFKTLVAQVDILETLTPLEFLSFRHRLDSASGFQSSQFRELEFVLGHKRFAALKHYPGNSEQRRRLAARYQQPTLWDAFLHYLRNENYAIPSELLNRDVTQPIQPTLTIQMILIEIYRNDLKNMQICERLLDLDEGVQEWRYRHVKMVERTIGTKPGTGGSTGVEYLRNTLFTPVFPDLWVIRAEL